MLKCALLLTVFENETVLLLLSEDNLHSIEMIISTCDYCIIADMKTPNEFFNPLFFVYLSNYPLINLVLNNKNCLTSAFCSQFRFFSNYSANFQIDRIKNHFFILKHKKNSTPNFLFTYQTTL